MRSSQTIITLFAKPKPSRRGPSAFMISTLVHGVLLILVFLGLSHIPQVDSRTVNKRYTVRLLNLQSPPPPIQWHAPNGHVHPVQQADMRTASSSGRPGPMAAPSMQRNSASLGPTTQTLVQPDIPPDPLVKLNIPLPMVVMWNQAPTPVKTIAPQPPLKTAAAINVQPSLELPNQEATLADVRVSSTAFTTQVPMPVPSTTMPLSVPGPEQAKQIPQTASKSAAALASAKVISVSDIQMQQGTIAVPAINQIAQSSFIGSLTPGQIEGQSPNGGGKTNNKQNGAGTGQGTGDQGDKTIAAAGGGPVAVIGGWTAASSDGADANPGPDAEPSVEHIKVPMDGQFGVVVVGGSLADEYPETVGMWNGRLAYTVYLQVGAGKSWILQYSLPRAAEASASGQVVQPKAPWPYDILRPSIDPDANTDAILVHGFVSAAGRFEKLAIAFPPKLAEAAFLLRSLQQWQFRPAMQNGKAAAVEVLLIIPVVDAD
ncbi:MAG TPA: hypothetical protein VHX63_08970 [Acidobacteriaceae bacterium]|jgi:hypothetical protein|nr:hypothetical protein [Acidobacteriaceae bacterium]